VSRVDKKKNVRFGKLQQDFTFSCSRLTLEV